jgi:hypothetical protein
VLDWLNCRVLGINYGALFRGRFVACFGVAAVAVVVIGGGGRLLGLAGVAGVPALIATSLVYMAIVATAIWLRPNSVGVTREQLSRIVKLGTFWCRTRVQDGSEV